MSEYDRERVAGLFDERSGAKSPASEHKPRSGGGIPQIARQTALDRLGLTNEDILLDVGAGTGDMAIAAARICRQVIGIDVSKKSLEQATTKAEREGLSNVVFAHGAFEDPCVELDLCDYGINKILAVYSLHHLPDRLKKQSLIGLAGLLRQPARVVIGDIMFFDDPGKHAEEFDEVLCDAGDTNFPSRVEFLTSCLEEMGAKVYIEEIHPLVGVVRADFV